MQHRHSHQKPPLRRRSVQVGTTLAELLVAALIISVSLIGMVSTWLYMFQRTIINDDRAGAYQAARLVLERTRGDGFYIASPTTQSSPATDINGFSLATSSWSSSNFVPIRFYDANLQELQPKQGNDEPAMRPANTRYVVYTTRTYSEDYPTGRSDLNLMKLNIAVYLVDSLNQKSDISSIELQSFATLGGA